MENKVKMCENCKYARQHYFILNGKFTTVINEMHCANGNVTKKQFEKNFRENLPCKYYETNELRAKENAQCIKRLLIRISEQLDNALQVLENITIDK